MSRSKKCKISYKECINLLTRPYICGQFSGRDLGKSSNLGEFMKHKDTKQVFEIITQHPTEKLRNMLYFYLIPVTVIETPPLGTIVIPRRTGLTGYGSLSCS